MVYVLQAFALPWVFRPEKSEQIEKKRMIYIIAEYLGLDLYKQKQ